MDTAAFRDVHRHGLRNPARERLARRRCSRCGFTSLEIPQVRYEELWKLFPEFAPFEPECRFSGCLHMAEPDCGIKQAVERGEIAAMRYENYRQMLLECKDKNR